MLGKFIKNEHGHGTPDFKALLGIILLAVIVFISLIIGIEQLLIYLVPGMLGSIALVVLSWALSIFAACIVGWVFLSILNLIYRSR